MATIYSNRTDGTGSHTVVAANSASTWQGGVTPSASDLVYIVGYRTTWNSGSTYKWAGTRTCTVASTSGFASAGFFYTVTTDSQIIKVNYNGTTSTTFLNCEIDETDYPWDTVRNNGYIANGYYIHNPANIVTIDGVLFECDEMIIQEGGWINIINGGELKINKGLTVRDGRLLGQGAGTITFDRPSASLSVYGYFNTDNYYMSIIDIDGGEVRTYATVQANTTYGDYYLSVNTPTNGTFAWGDDIAVFTPGEYRYLNKEGYTYAYGYSLNYGEECDEGLDVVGYSNNKIYAALRNGSRGTVLATGTDSRGNYIELQQDSLYFNVGDRLIAFDASNNPIVVDITIAEDDAVTLYDYDFSSPSANLNDFFVDDDTCAYSNGWVLNSYGLTQTQSGYKELLHKYFYDRDVVIEAEISPLDQYSTGNRGTGDFGIITSYDPAFRPGHRGYDSFKTDYLRIDDAADQISIYTRSVTNYADNRMSRDTGGIRNELRLPATYIVDNRKGMYTAYANGQEISKEFRRDGNFKGITGLFVDSNTQATFRRLKIKVPTVKVYGTIVAGTSLLNIPVNNRIWRTGFERLHSAGARVVKIASINTGNGNHTDLAFAQRGQYGNGEWPIVKGVGAASNTNSNFPYLHNHDTNIDYYYNLGDGTGKYLIFDLTKEQEFTHVSFQPRTYDVGTTYGYRNVAIYGSHDNVNWDLLYGPVDDTKKWYYRTYNRMAFYPTGTVTYRYVKFATDGAQVSPYQNRYVNLGVHNFSDGYKLELNNASDFNIGDYITVMSDSGYSWSSTEYEAYYALISNGGADPESFYHSGWIPRAQITGKSGNMIYLDKPIFWGYVEGRDSVTIVKLTRNFVVRGMIYPGSNSTNDWRWPTMYINSGSSYGRIYKFQNILFDKMGSYRYSGSGSYNRGIVNRNNDPWSCTLFEGTVHMMGPDGTTWSGVGDYSGHSIHRNTVQMCMYSGNWFQSTPNYAGAAVWNTKTLGCILGIYGGTAGFRAYDWSYNEVATCDVGIYISSRRLNRAAVPMFSRINRNTVKGTSGYGYQLYLDTSNPTSADFVECIANRVRATDDQSQVGYSVSNPMQDFDALSEHTGSRMSRYNNGGHFGFGDTGSDLQPQEVFKNFGRYGYDIAALTNCFAIKDYSNPDITRFYRYTSDSYLPMFGIEFDMIQATDAPVEVDVYFEYRQPLINRIQNDGTDDGRLRIQQIQGATRKSIAYSEVPQNLTNGWHVFQQTFIFDQVKAPCAIYVAMAAYNGYLSIRNSRAVVKTNNADRLAVRANTFNMARIWNPYRENDGDIKPLKANRATAMKRIKF